MYRIALVSREVYPFPPSAGLGAYVTAAANALAEDAEVTIVTTDLHEERYEELRAAASPLLPRNEVRFAFVRHPRPEESKGYFDLRHLWSARALEKLKELYPDGGPHLVEFPDYLGEGAVTVQARNTLDPALRNTLVCVRLHTTKEMTDVLNGHLPNEPSVRVACDLERYALAHADRILWPGGDVLETYKRFYNGALAPTELVRHPVLPTAQIEKREVEPAPELRLLYVGRLERRKGVQNLLRAVTGLESRDWRLTLVGGDTNTASLGTSMLAQLMLAAADDPRIEFKDPVSRDGVLELLACNDVLLSPSLWECWPTVVLEALSQNRPVLASPVGGHVELVEPGESGWLAADASEDALATSLERLLDRRHEVGALTERRGPRRRFEELTRTDSVRESYAELAAQAARRKRRRRFSSTPLVSVVVPYFMLDEHVEETVESIFAQTYPRLEVVVVNDGSFRDEDRVLDELTLRLPVAVVSQQNSGLGRARNLGISQSRGKYVLPLDPDDAVRPTFVERCVEVLEQRPEVAYVNCWSRYVDKYGHRWGPPSAGFRPFSNEAGVLAVLNVAGAASAVIRRRVFDRGFWYSVDATSHEDWLFYRELAAAGLFGHTIPEQLLVYRVRAASMFRQVAGPHDERLMAESAAHQRERQVQWTS